MSCSRPNLRLLRIQRPLRTPSPSSSYSPAATMAASNFLISVKPCLFPSLSSLQYSIPLKEIRASRGNRVAISCFHTSVAKEESTEAISTAVEECEEILAGESFCRSNGEGVSYVLVNPSSIIDPKKLQDKSNSSLTAGFNHFWTNIIRKRIPGGVLMNMGLITSLVVFVLAFDLCSWRIAKHPLEPFYFLRPFLISAALSGFAGWLYVPTVDKMKIHQILREEGPSTHSSKRGTPTMGGLFFIPIGIAVASHMANSNSSLVYGTILVTLSFAAIGLIDDLLSCIKGHNYGLPGWIKLCLQAAVGLWFSFWLNSANISMPLNMKLSVHLPQPFGLVYFGNYYLALTAFCFAAMGNGVNLTDGLDGLAGGIAAWAFIGMSVAILAVSPGLSLFGASMAGACVGFLFHNRYKASIFMGDTGSLGLGGALAAMASCTGMFLPLFICSIVFVMEVLSVIVQVFSIKVTKRLYGVRRRVFRMAPIHHHFELCGFKEPVIVASAYFVSCILALIAGYIGILSA